ncbi:MAG: type II toxin-antitoxin system VapC family toxin [Caldilineaceae bacterium]|nr:type II toxin-antitoxin system VapC family toxin [Caldilineaceae bacterium]
MRNPSVCVDANIVINFLIAGPFSDKATILIKHWSRTRTRLIVPTLFDYEVVSALRRAVHLKQINRADGEFAYQRFLHIPVSRQHNNLVLDLSREMAERFNSSRIYDASYLAVAHLHSCDMWTADRRLYNSVHEKLQWVRWIDEVAPDALP